MSHSGTPSLSVLTAYPEAESLPRRRAFNFRVDDPPGILSGVVEIFLFLKREGSQRRPASLLRDCFGG